MYFIRPRDVITHKFVSVICLAEWRCTRLTWFLNNSLMGRGRERETSASILAAKTNFASCQRWCSVTALIQPEHAYDHGVLGEISFSGLARRSDSVVSVKLLVKAPVTPALTHSPALAWLLLTSVSRPISLSSEFPWALSQTAPLANWPPW